VVLVGPVDVASAHHFYAGISRAPALSLLEALLLMLGGTRPDGGRRYEEIVVVNAGIGVDPLDKPEEEVISLRTPTGGSLKHGENWETWWYRRPAKQRRDLTPDDASRPSPRRKRWAEPDASNETMFPVQLLAESGAKFPNRFRQLRQIVERLSTESHSALLLVELASLNYYRPSQEVIEGHSQLSGEALKYLMWLKDWINGRSLRPTSRLDVIFYSRNGAQLDAFMNNGLPERPAQREQSGAINWPQFVYNGRNIHVIRFPGGPHPWGDMFSARDARFERIDGCPSDAQTGQSAFPGRTLRALLRGRSPSGEPVRLRFGAPNPVVPSRTTSVLDIDAAFWAKVDVEAIEAALDRRYFGARQTQAVTGFLAELRWRRKLCQTEPTRLETNEVRARWKQNSSLVLWGKGGGGKSFFGETIAPLLFGHDALLFECQKTRSTWQFQAQFFGAPPGYQNSDTLTAAGAHLVGNRGYAVVILDEFQEIHPENFADGVKTIYGLVQNRIYSASTPQLHGNQPIPLWNTIFVATANLDSWPPASVSETDRGAIMRRFRAYEILELNDEQVTEFVRWKLCRVIEDQLSGVTFCHCEPLLGEIRRLGLAERTPDLLAKKLQSDEGPIAAVLSALARSGVTVGNAPAYFDVTALVREALE
jgi:hypothetical protein